MEVRLHSQWLRNSFEPIRCTFKMDRIEFVLMGLEMNLIWPDHERLHSVTEVFKDLGLDIFVDEKNMQELRKALSERISRKEKLDG